MKLLLTFTNVNKSLKMYNYRFYISKCVKKFSEMNFS